MEYKEHADMHQMVKHATVSWTALEEHAMVKNIKPYIIEKLSDQIYTSLLPEIIKSLNFNEVLELTKQKVADTLAQEIVKAVKR